MKKRKLLVVAGAGASIEFGMPSVTAIDTLFEQWARTYYPLAEDPERSLYTFYKEKVHEHYVQNPRNRENVLMNFERHLFGMQQLANLLIDKDRNSHHLNAFIESAPELPEVNVLGRRLGIATGHDLEILHGHLVDKLLDHLRGLGRNLPSQKNTELNLLSSFFKALSEEYQVGIINLNYDNVILTACPDKENGFDSTGNFDKQKLFEADWNFHYQLHGSIHFDLKGTKTDMHKIFWNSDLNSPFQSNSSGRNNNYSNEGNRTLNSAIIAGLDKTNQILRDPFMSYYSQMVRAAHEADIILFLGYGFGDRHLNKCFYNNRFDEKRRNVVVIDYAGKEQDGLQFRQDSWSHGLFDAAPYNAHQMDKGIPQMAYYYANSKTFQTSMNPEYPLRVWYNGLLEACRNSALILGELRK